MKLLLLIFFFLNSFIIYGQNFQQKLFADDSNPGVFFGRFVSLQKDFAFISAYQDFENGSASGSLYIFKKTNSKYQQSQKLFPDDGGVEEYFGYSLSSYDDWVITGAHHDSDFGASSGKAYLLHLKNDNWSFYQTLLPPDPAEADEFGKTVDIYGDFAVSCSYLDDDNGTNSGSVYIFRKEDNIWNLFQKIQADQPVDHSQFGLAMDIYKDKLIVGAPYTRHDEIVCGAAYIFELTDSKWIQTASLFPEDLELNDEFGITVKINKNYAFVGSIKDDDLGKSSGSVYVYEKIDKNWVLKQKLLAPDGEAGDGFGIAIETDSNYLYIGSYFDDDHGTNSGSVYIFKNNFGDWDYQTKFSPDDSDESDAFGASISVFEDEILVGAYSDDDYGFFAGSAYVFSKKKILTKTKNQINNTNDIFISPTIFKDKIRISSLQTTTFNVDIYDISGNIISHKNDIRIPVELNTNTISKGIYFLKISNSKINKTVRIVKI